MRLSNSCCAQSRADSGTCIPLYAFFYEELQHLKIENIGLVEVMGLHIIPERQKNVLQELKEALLSNEIVLWKGDVQHLQRILDWKSRKVMSC